MNEKIKGYLNIAQKAGYVIFGGDNLKGYRHKLYLILKSKTAEKNLSKICERTAEETGAMLVEIDNLGELLARPSCKAVGIKNKGLSEVIIKLL